MGKLKAQHCVRYIIMFNGVKCELNGKKYYLVYNGSSMFDVEELLNGKIDLQVILTNNRLCLKAFVILANQGVLVRRYLGFNDEMSEITADEIAMNMSALQMVKSMITIREAVSKAIIIGCEQEIKDDDNIVDLSITELEKKTKQ